MQTVPVMMPVPQSEDSTDQKITELKARAEKQVKCIKFLSWFFILVGIGGILNGIHCMHTAKHNANYIVTHKKMPWGRHHPQPHPPKPEFESAGSDFMTRDEFELIDIFKNLGMITLVMGLVLLGIGKMNRWAVKCKKGKWVHHIFRKHIASFFVFTFFYLISKGQGKAFMTIFMNICDDETRAHMEQKMKGKIGMCPVMLVLLLVQLLNLYKIRNYDHSIEKVELLQEVKKEQEKKQSILVAATELRQ